MPQFQKTTLANGLTIIAETSDAALSASLGYFVRAGARDENDAIAGVSHFLEHMLFKGTDKRSADDINRQFDEIGADFNACTGEEYTAYYAGVLPEYIPAAAELFADMLRPALRQDDFEMEKNVILEEIQMYEDMPPFCCDEKIRESFFNGHPLGRSVLGTKKSITELTSDQMRDYITGRYAPENVLLVGAGKIDFDQFVAEAEKNCGHWEPYVAPREYPKPDYAFTQERFEKSIATQEYVMQFYPGPDASDDAILAAKLLAVIIGDSSGSRFYWDLIDPGLADTASFSHHEYQDAGIFYAHLCCDPESAAENTERINAICEEVTRNGVTEKELSAAKNKVASRIVLAAERPSGALFGVALDWFLAEKYCGAKKELALVEAITLDDITRIIERFPLNQSARIAVGPPAAS